MKKKFKLIVPSFVALIFCMLLIAGSTFALFTSQASASIAVTSGRVQINANFDENSLEVYSAKAVESFGENDDVAGTISSGDFAGKYIFDLQERTAVSNSKTYHLFANNADNTETGALLESDKITLTNMTPGDKVKATLKLENNSNVNIKYRVKVNLVSGLKLFEGLQIKLDGVLLQGVAKTGTWTFLAAPTSTDDNMGDLNIEILLPLEAGNEYQDLSTVLNFTLEAVQANAKTTNETLNTNINVQQEVEDHNQDQVVSDDENLVEVTVPATAVADTTKSLEVKVEPQNTISELVLTSEQTAQSYDLDVLVTTQTGEEAPVTAKYNAENDANAEALKVKMFVGTGLKGVKLYHKSVELTKVDSLAAVDALNEFYYDSESGYITLMTNSFSEYTVVYNKDLVVETVVNNVSTLTTYEATETTGEYLDDNGKVVVPELNENGEIEASNKEARIGNIYYNTLSDAVSAVQNNQTITLLVDLSSSQTIYANGINYKIDLGGHEFTSNASTAFEVKSGYSLEVKNGTINANGSSNAFMSYGDLVVSGLTLNNTASYALQIQGNYFGNPGSLDIQNSTINTTKYGIYPVAKTGYGNTVSAPSVNAKNVKVSATGSDPAVAIIGSTIVIDSCDITAKSYAINVVGSATAPSSAVSNVVIKGNCTITSTEDNAIQAMNGSTFAISNGVTVNAPDYYKAVVAGKSSVGNNPNPGRAEITGGTYNAEVGKMAQGTLEISGGLFKYKPDDQFLKSGYMAVEAENEFWEVKQATYTWYVHADNVGNYRVNNLTNQQESVDYTWTQILGSTDHGSSYPVKNNDGSFTDAQNLGLAISGDTIYFAAGTYTTSGNLFVNDGVTLIGNSLNDTIIESIDKSYNYQNVLNVNGNVTIKNMQFLTNNKHYAVGPNIYNINDPDRTNYLDQFSHDIVVEDCAFGVSTTSSKNQYGINFPVGTGKGSLTVKNTTFNNLAIGLCGLKCSGSNSFTITGNTFTNCASAIDYVGTNFVSNQTELWQESNTLNNCPINRY